MTFTSTSLDLAKLEMFLVMAEELHFGRAAERLHITQPALSRAIRSLEKDLGCALFERSTRRVELTGQGIALVQPARHVLVSAGAARQAVDFAGRGLTGQLRVGYPGPSATHHITRLVQLLRRERPGIDLHLRSGVLGYESAHLLLMGELDLAFLRWSSAPSGLDSRIVGVDRHVVMLPATHPLAGTGEVSIRDLAREEWIILTAEASPLTERFWSTCRKAGFIPHIAARVPDAWTAMSMVEAGVGLTLNYETTVANSAHSGVATVGLVEIPEPSHARLAWRSTHVTPLVRNVLALTKGVFTNPDVATGSHWTHGAPSWEPVATPAEETT